MEGFTYTDIFETKGIEYLIIILFFMLLVPLWYIVTRPGKVVKQMQSAVNVLTAGVLRIPQGLFFSKNHTWVHLEKSGEAKIGLDDFLMHVVGKMKINQIKQSGEQVKKGEVLAEIVQDGKQLKVHSPISGKIIDSNLHVNENVVKEDPYDSGWFYAVEPDNWKAETSGFYLAEEASDWIQNELLRFKDFLNTSLARYSNQPAMVTLQEGGELKADPLDDLQPEIWNDFQKEFLDK
mgnify:CR=1 FL=1